MFQSLGDRYGFDPDEIRQEACMRLWRALSAGKLTEAPGVVAVTLVRAARQVVIDLWRYQRSRPSTTLPGRVPFAGSTERAALTRIELTDTLRTLAALGNRGKVIWLNRAMGYSTTETADMLGIRPRMVYQHTLTWDQAQPGYRPKASRIGEERQQESDQRLAPIADRVGRGESVAAIARELGINERTLRKSLARYRERQGVNCAAAD